MSRPITFRVLCAALAIGACATANAAEDPALLKDLTSVVALLGVPCGQVVSATRINDNDHVVTCTDGHRYHVHVNPQGRVVADKA